MPKTKTSEELLAENEKLLEELDKPETPPESDSPPTSEVTPEPVMEPVVEPEVTPEPVVEPVVEPAPEPEPQTTPSPDYKKKFSESSREAQKIVAKNRKLNQAIDEANEIIEPTEEELQAEYPDWDLLDETTKRIAKESMLSTRRFAIISQGRAESQKIEKWSEDVLKFTDDPQTLIDNPDLEGKTEEFKVFASEESNNSVPLKILVNSFLYEQSRTAKPKSKGQMFPDGSGGPNENPKSKGDKISVEESEVLRKTNYPKYKEMLKSGKIATEI